MTKLSESQFMERAATVELVVMDVDGVLTDGRIVLTSGGEEAKCFNVKDGHGIMLAQSSGLKIAWVSGRFSKVTRIRAEELGIENLSQGERRKLPVVRKMAEDMGVAMQNILYIGDDIVDTEAMEAVGLAVAVADACAQVAEVAHWITRNRGGHGAVREILDMVLQARS
ncbi:MAG: HAD hydrolase family protein [Nitrospinota bacterium]|nr:HAD hydrolase family protein [Nitrospinota bacterium]